ncbi:MAG TPA: sigma-70 family RNA polymerase sigma factor [Anaerolineales bacterium]|nr:sigma-70 family RNA polymerase sigma factor [Anaerolineales bacterium]
MDESLQLEGVSCQMKLSKSKTNPSDGIPVDSTSSSFESLFHEYWAPIYRLLLRLVTDPSEAEDLALEAFFRLYQKHPLPEKGFNTRGWLHKVATNLGLHSIRSFKRREKYQIDAGRGALDEAPENQPSEIFADNEDRRIARKALAQMNPRQAEILVMRYSGMAYKEIASALKLSHTSIGPLLLRAEREFEKRYRALEEEKK